jgi:hypothetical protein
MGNGEWVMGNGEAYDFVIPAKAGIQFSRQIEIRTGFQPKLE